MSSHTPPCAHSLSQALLRLTGMPPIPPPLNIGSMPIPLNPPPPVPMGEDDDEDGDRAAPRRILSYWTPEEKQAFMDTFKVWVFSWDGM